MEPVGDSNAQQPVETPKSLPAPPVVPQLPAPNPPLIGDVMRRPVWLWLTHVLPAILLFLSFFHAYYLIAGETNAEQRQTAGALAVGFTVLTLAVGAYAIHLHLRKQTISNAAAGVLFIASAFFVVLGIVFLSGVIPRSIPNWIIPQNELFNCCFVLGMPGMFYTLLLLSSFPRGGLTRECGVCLSGLVLAPFVLGFFGSLLSVSNTTASNAVETVMFWSVLLSGAAVVSFATIRGTLLAYTWIRRRGPGVQWTFMFFVALAGPMTGLWLNQGIPFPSNFHAPIVYMLALINGGLLMMPVFRSIFWHRVIWLAQCAMLPFSAYFFFVFLPWLPLAPFAMIIVGLGSLILVPIILGLVHGYRVVDGYREEIRDGSAWKPAVLGLIAVSLLPVGYGVRL